MTPRDEERQSIPGEVTPEMERMADETREPHISKKHRRTLQREINEARKEEQRRKAETGEEHQPYFAGGTRMPTPGEGQVHGERMSRNDAASMEGDINQEAKYKR